MKQVKVKQVPHPPAGSTSKVPDYLYKVLQLVNRTEPAIGEYLYPTEIRRLIQDPQTKVTIV